MTDKELEDQLGDRLSEDIPGPEASQEEAESSLEEQILASLLDEAPSTESVETRPSTEQLPSAASRGPDAEQRPDEPLLDEIATGFFRDEPPPEPLDVDAARRVEATPPAWAEHDAAEMSYETLSDDGFFEFQQGETPSSPVDAGLATLETPKGGMEMIDDTIVSDVTLQPPDLPSDPTEHPLYQEVETFISQGDWQAAVTPMEELLTLYPEDAYLQEVANSVRTRSALLEGVPEVAPARRSFVARSLRFALPVAVVIGLVAVAAVVFIALRQLVLPQVIEERQRAQISQIRQDAQTALASGDYDRAMLAYNEILELLPGDPEALIGLEQASQLRATVSVYSEAIAEMEAHRWESALSLLEQIEAEQPNYRDVVQRIVFVKEQQNLSDRFAEAEAAFDRGYYELAIQEYEELQALDYGFQRETVQDHLFLSYLQLGLSQEAEAAGDVQLLQVALENLEKALALRPDDAQAKGESQLLRLYIAGLDESDAGNWPQAVADLTPVYEARPDFAEGSVAQFLYDALIAWGDQLMEEEQYELAMVRYQEARLITGVDATGLDRKIAMVRQMTATPTPTAEPTEAAPATATSAPASGAPARPATATPRPLAYSLRGMSVRPNCNGFGYIHGVVWSSFNMPMGGITLQAFNTTTGLGPLVSIPTNEDGIYQIILEQDQIEGLWVVQVVENGQVASQAWGQRLGGGCVNGAQELKIDWQRASQLR